MSAGKRGSSVVSELASATNLSLKIAVNMKRGADWQSGCALDF